jgi:hypothetical protein
MVKSTGAFSEAATVSPTSTLREMTMPSMGEEMVQWSRLICARLEVGLLDLQGRLRLVEARHRRVQVRLGRGVLLDSSTLRLAVSCASSRAALA